MEHFSYSIRDFGLSWRLALSPRAILASLWLCAVLLLVALTCTWAAGKGDLAYGAISWLLGSSMGERSLSLNPELKTALIPLFLIGGWMAWARSGVRLSRISAVALCMDRRARSPSLRAFSRGYSRYAERAPLALAAFALPALIVLTLWWAVYLIPFIGLWGAVLLSPLALLAGMWIGLLLIESVIAIPLHFASVGVRGGDTYESLSRVMMYLTMSPLAAIWWGLANLVSALIFAALVTGLCAAACAVMGLLALGFDFSALAILVDISMGLLPANVAPNEIAALDARVLGMLFRFALVFAAGASFLSALHAGNVIWFLLLRWRNDAAPVTEVFDPRQAFEIKASDMEREQAKRSLGLIAREAPVAAPAQADPAAPKQAAPEGDNQA